MCFDVQNTGDSVSFFTVKHEFNELNFHIKGLDVAVF